MTLNTAVIYGSARKGRQGIKAARFVIKKLEERGHTVKFLDTEEIGLPFLDRMYKEFDPADAPPAMTSVHDALVAADGFVIISGEYNHRIPPALKNLLDHFQSEYHYKPSGIVTYSAGPFGGVRALVNLRAILAELGTPSIPSAFPVSAVQSSFDDEGNALNERYDKGVIKFIDEYEWYAKALRTSRRAEKCATDGPIQQDLCRGKGS